MLTITSLGRDTLRAYRNTITQLDKTGDWNFDYLELDSKYCDEQGVRLALRDKGRLDLRRNL